MTKVKQTEGNVWGMKDLPDFRGRKAFVLAGAFYGSVIALMAKCNFEKAETVEDADVVVFIGGADIEPSLYGQEKLPTTSTNPRRDEYEVAIYHKAVELGKPIFGICRGAQLLHALNGGELWQHVENHAGPDHWIYDIEEDVRVLVTSYHHQMLKTNENIEIVAVCNEQISKKFIDDKSLVQLPEGEEHVELEIEAGIYRDTKCFFVQGHPEVGSPEYQSWTMAKLYDFIYDLEAIQSDEGVADNLTAWLDARKLG